MLYTNESVFDVVVLWYSVSLFKGGVMCVQLVVRGVSVSCMWLYVCTYILHTMTVTCTFICKIWTSISLTLFYFFYLRNLRWFVVSKQLTDWLSLFVSCLLLTNKSFKYWFVQFVGSFPNKHFTLIQEHSSNLSFPKRIFDSIRKCILLR